MIINCFMYNFIGLLGAAIMGAIVGSLGLPLHYFLFGVDGLLSAFFFYFQIGMVYSLVRFMWSVRGLTLIESLEVLKNRIDT